MHRTPLTFGTPHSANGLQDASKRDSDRDNNSDNAAIPRSHSFASHVPASLGIGTPNKATKSLSERLNLSKSSSSSSSLARSTSNADGLQFSSAATPARNASELGSLASIPSWGPSASGSFSHSPRGLSSASSTGSLGSASSSASSRNFLVPIGATGARQRLSIANASQQRKVSASDDGTRSAISPTSPIGTPQQQHQQRNDSGLNRSQSNLPNLKVQDRTSSQGLSRSSTVDAFAPSPSGSTGLDLSQASSRATSTPAEQVQQAALQRLSSQRMPPGSRRSVSDSVPSRYSSSRPTSGSSTAEQEQQSPTVPAIPSATWRRAEPVATSSAPPVQASPTVAVPDRTASSLGRDMPQSSTTAPAITHPVPRRYESQQRGDTRDVGDASTVTSTPLTLAETYKRAMLERDAERAKSTSHPQLPMPSQTSAPTLDLQLPSSKLFADADPVQQRQEGLAPHQTKGHDESADTTTLSQARGSSLHPSAMPSPTAGVTDRCSAISSHAVPPQPATASSSSPKPRNEARTVPERRKPVSAPKLADGSNTTSVARLDDQNLKGSYLALRDEDEDQQSKGTPRRETAAPDASRHQSQPPVFSSPFQAPASAAEPPRTPPADRSFVEFSTPPGETLTTPKAETPAPDFSSARNGHQPTSPIAGTSKSVEAERPDMSRDSSLKTLHTPPHKLEAQPAPREGAALAAGATAAATASPIVMADTNTSTQSDAASPVINGERTVQPSDETADAARWRRSQEALASFSPMQQSRFSEASTDFSDSRAPTRNESRYSGRASSVSSADAFEDEPTDAQMLPTSAWHEVENALRRFRDKTGGAAADRGNLLRAVLLPFLALEAETATVDVVGSGIYVKGKARRALFFDWIRSLLLELQHVQTSADRGALLESIACIIESRNFSASILSTDPEDEARFSSVFGHILSYAIGELNKKGVYQNTLIFSGRLLAVAFFRVNGVASKLLRALPVNRFALERVAREFDWQKRRPTDFARFANRFPATLRQLCYKDSREYLKMLDSESANGNDGHSPEDDRYLVCQPEVEVEMSGNWLRRWQSDDSELFFSFCRSYHRQLAGLFASSKSLESVSKYFFGGPGYAHLATCVHQKCLALVHRVILSVTTLSSQKNFNPAAGETANVLSGSTAGKPRILEAANRRCTAIVVDIVRAPAGSNMIFAPMLGLHVKALVKRTSLYDVQGVFCLLDWLDGVLSHMDSNDLINEGLIDVSFVITTIGMLLETADHALALMRTIAFCYANFGVLTATSENRAHFCEQILLKPSVFHKLFLSWSFTIRAYYLHLLVFRLARIADFPSPSDDPNGKSAVRVVRLFNQRLEALRKRHDLLSPEIDSSSDGTKSEDGKSRRSGTSTFVSTIKRTSSEGTSVEGSVDGRVRAEKMMGMTAVAPSTATVPAKAPEAKKPTHSKTKSWLKAFRGSSKADGKGSSSPRAVQAFSPTTGKVTNAGESDDDSKTIGSSRTTPRTSFDSVSSDAMSDVSTLAGSVRGGKSGKGGSSSGFEFDIKEQQKQQQQQQQQQARRLPSPLVLSNGSTSNTNAAPPLSPTHEAGIAKDTVFDLQSTHAQHPPTPGRTPQSPRISKAFSRRASILPGHASELVAGLDDDEANVVPPMPDLPPEHFGLGLSGVNGDSTEVYSESLHIYAVQSLREYEQTVQEHDEFFASLPADQSTQVPRLPVNWPAMWSSTGE